VPPAPRKQTIEILDFVKEEENKQPFYYETPLLPRESDKTGTRPHELLRQALLKQKLCCGLCHERSKESLAI